MYSYYVDCVNNDKYMAMSRSNQECFNMCNRNIMIPNNPKECLNASLHETKQRPF